MISAILSLLGSSAVGTIIGGVFAFLNKKQDAELELAKLQHELVLRDKDIELMKAEQTGVMRVASEFESLEKFAMNKATDYDRLDAETLNRSGKWGSLIIFAESVRRFIRPVATIALLAGALWVNYIILTHVTANWGDLSNEQKSDIIAQCLGWIFGQSSAIIAYWFVSRGKVAS